MSFPGSCNRPAESLLHALSRYLIRAKLSPHEPVLPHGEFMLLFLPHFVKTMTALIVSVGGGRILLRERSDGWRATSNPRDTTRDINFESALVFALR